METWMKPLPLQEFPAKALLYGVGITNKRQADCARETHCFEGRHKVPPTAYAGRHSPSVCKRCLQESTKQPLGLSTGSVAVFQELCKETIGSCCEAGITPCCCAQADTFSCAAGTAGKQKWSLILPSSARVSELTYVTIIGTRYPELDNFQNDIIQFGNYLQAEQCTRGGFVPIFWDAPYSYIHASTDIGEVVD